MSCECNNQCECKQKIRALEAEKQALKTENSALRYRINRLTEKLSRIHLLSEEK